MNSKKAVRSILSKMAKHRFYSLFFAVFMLAAGGFTWAIVSANYGPTQNNTSQLSHNAYPPINNETFTDVHLSLVNYTLATQPSQTSTSSNHAASSNGSAEAISNASGLNSFFAYEANRGPLDFSLHVKGPGNGPTLFVVGGIQGDEPGAFSAASLLVTHYKITKGRLVVVPNLNFNSIVQRDRGSNGDMNRKFAALPENDPEYATVTRIKNLILNPHVDAILNMHDGSGFYRPAWEDAMRNPKRWGQSVIIDQATIGEHSYCDLEEVAENVLGRANDLLLKPDHKYYLKNTRTSEGDKEMEKTLTYFAIKHGKPAFGVEASKSFSLPVRTYYHIQVLESFMEHMGIEFERKFDPTPNGVALALGTDVKLTFADSNLTLPLDDVRSKLNYFPIKKGDKLEFSSPSPLVTVVEAKNKKDLVVYYGNRPVTSITPDYMDYAEGLDKIELIVDGRNVTVRPGEVVPVGEKILVKSMPGYRINAIGAQVNNGASECNYNLQYTNFEKKFSLDNNNSLFRIELYQQPKGKLAQAKDRFAGMILVQFPVTTASTPTVLPGVEGGKETLLGY